MGVRELDSIYTTRLKNHPEGHALYRNYSAKQLKPGSCGYFDIDGEWKGIIQLTDAEALASKGYTPLDEVFVEFEPGYTSWGPKKSELVKGYRLEGTVAANVAPGASVGSTVAFKNETDQGAVLITEPPIRHYKAQHETLFLDWMVANTTKLLSNCSDIAKYGVWIVTKTYSTTQCARAVLSSRNAEVTIAVDADVADVATASPSVSWWKRGSDSSWNIQNDHSGVVVFMSGIQFKPKTFRKSEFKAVVDKKNQKFWRSGEVTKALRPIEVPMEEKEDPIMLSLSPMVWPEPISNA